VRAEWEPDELIGAWTLAWGDWDLIANKGGVTRLGFTVMLKFYEIEGRFPAYREEVPQAAVAYLGSLVKVEPALFAKYSWRGRTIEYHRAQIRRAYGTRLPTEDDEDRWAQWLAGEICPTETNRDRLAAALRRRCRSEKVEPPSTGQVERVVASGCRQFDDDFAATTAGRLGPAACGRLEELLSRPNVLAELKSDPGPLGLDTLLAEIGKLSTVRALGLDEAVFGGASDRIVAAWRARAARMYPSDFTDCGDPVRYTVLAALCWTIARNYDQTVKYATALRLRTAENWNSANDKIYYGREGVITGDDREHAEVSMLALHLLQSSLVFINTQLLQAVRRDPAWAGKLTEEDRRGLSPLFCSHVNPYGRFRLDMDTRLDLTAA
jgi:hypothetical protein